MSLRLPQPVPPVPDDTARIARAAFPRGNPYLLLRDRLGPVFDDAGFADLYPRRGQPAYTPWRLALVTLLQFREGLSDRQAAEAVRARIDWKYLLALELADAGFDHTVLCEFRGRLLGGEAPSIWGGAWRGGPGRVGGRHDIRHQVTLCRLPLSRRGHQPRRLALLPLSAEPTHGRRDAGRPRHRREP